MQRKKSASLYGMRKMTRKGMQSNTANRCGTLSSALVVVAINTSNPTTNRTKLSSQIPMGERSVSRHTMGNSGKKAT